jgi:Txe/YoeB family toxin of Txe-Axe toxin-antitoxin module
MRSETTDEFWELYRALPQQMRRRAREAHEQFERDPFHPGLNFEEVDKHRGLWSARITRGYRVLGIREGDAITWFWIGPHREYEKLIRGK